MNKLKLITSTPAPDTIKERVRATLRTTKQPNILQCPSCGSRTHITLTTGTMKQKCCAMCFMNDRRIVVME